MGLPPEERNEDEAVRPAGQVFLGTNHLHSLGRLRGPFRSFLKAAQGGLPEKGAHFIPKLPVTG